MLCRQTHIFLTLYTSFLSSKALNENLLTVHTGIQLDPHLSAEFGSFVLKLFLFKASNLTYIFLHSFYQGANGVIFERKVLLKKDWRLKDSIPRPLVHEPTQLTTCID